MAEIIGATPEEQAAIVGGGAGMRPVLADNASGLLANNAAFDMAVNATLRKDEWEIIDERVNEEARRRLTVLELFRSRGLIQPVGIGDIERVTERLDAFTSAEVTFDGEVEAQKDRPNYRTDRRAVPIVSKGFDIGWRQLASSERRGNNLQVDSAGLAGRAVAHRMQNLITNGLATGGPSGGGLPGLTTAPDRIEVSIGTDWLASGADPVGNVEAMLEAAYTNFLFGPFVLMIPRNYWAAVQGDYSPLKGERTFLERFQAFADIEQVVPNDALTNGNVLLVQMTRDVADISLAQDLTTWQWQKTPAKTHFRVLMVGGPHIKSIQTESGTTVNGIVHLS